MFTYFIFHIILIIIEKIDNIILLNIYDLVLNDHNYKYYIINMSNKPNLYNVFHLI